MGTEPEPLFDEIARAAKRILNAPFSSVSFVGGRGEWCKARIGLDLPPGSRAQAMCAPIVEGTQAGCDDFPTKPVDRELLVATCRRWKHAGGGGEKSVA